MIKTFLLFFCVPLYSCLTLSAQTDTVVYALHTTKENRIKEYRNLVNNSITKNLSIPLTDSTTDQWQDAFMALELINYRSGWVDSRIQSAFFSLEKRSFGFQRAFIELICTNYPAACIPQIISFLNQTTNPKLFAMCAEYLLHGNKQQVYKDLILKRLDAIKLKLTDDLDNPILKMLQNNLLRSRLKIPPLADLLNTDFLHNEIVLFSFQRKNRNYPGLALVRGKDGAFIKGVNQNYFSVPQLARSITNMPGYLTNGNTAQGIFKMTGFDISKGAFIGPTTNIQLLMPFEKSTAFNDSIGESFANNYKNLLPLSWQDYYPVYESYYAGKAGRTEIIAHGTTVNPAYYKGQPYYPLTPTQGCLCTKELWSPTDGKRVESDQQKLVQALQMAGGATGYCIVIELDDQQKPVSIEDILPYLNQQ